MNLIFFLDFCKNVVEYDEEVEGRRWRNATWAVTNGTFIVL